MKNQQEEKRKEMEWPAPTSFKMCKDWTQFKQMFSPDRLSFRAAKGMLHDLMNIPMGYRGTSDIILSRLERINFCLFYTDFRNYIVLNDREKAKMRKTAYSLLMERLLSKFEPFSLDYKFATTFMFNGANYSITETCIETINTAIDFLKYKDNAPEEPHHRKTVSNFLMKIYEFNAEDIIYKRPGVPIEAVKPIDYQEKIKTLPSRLAIIQAVVPQALVNCRFYQTIVDEKMVETIDLLKQWVMLQESDRKRRQIITHLIEYEEHYSDGEVLELVGVWETILSRYGIKTASDAWLALWSIKMKQEKHYATDSAVAT